MMEATIPFQRKKVGRPPKQKSSENENVLVDGEVAFSHAELGDEALVAVSPQICEEQAVATAPTANTMENSSECRRSSRKKIIKFDVRDLLNKHRRPHKIQIEARIDSNAPSIITKSASQSASDTCSSGFIEKTSIIQRSVAFDNIQNAPSQVPISLKTQIFKPNQASSLIVAQMESIKKPPKSINHFASKKTEIMIPKRRGRPPKNRNLEVFKTVATTVKAQQIETKTQSEQAPKDTNLIEKIINKNEKNEIDVLQKQKSFQSQFENMLIDKNKADDPVKKIEISTTNTDTIVLDTQKSTSNDMDLQPSSSSKLENDKIAKTLPVESEEKNQFISSNSNSVSNTESSLARSHITLPLKKQLSKLQLIQAELNASETKRAEVEAVNEEYKNNCDSNLEATTTSTSTPIPQRRERRTGRKLGDGKNKTLEETFAEIAANSSKAILQAQTSTEISSSEIGEQSMQQSTSQPDVERRENSSPASDITIISIEASLSRSMSPKELTSQPIVLVDEPQRGDQIESEVTIDVGNEIIAETCTEANEKIEILVEISPEKDFAKNENVTCMSEIFEYEKQKSSIIESSSSSQKECDVILKSAEESSTTSSPKKDFSVSEHLSNLENSFRKISQTDIVLKESQRDTRLPLDSTQNRSIEKPADLILSDTTKDATLGCKDSIESSDKISETLKTSNERKLHEHKTKKKDRYEDRSPSSKSSKHHKRSSSSRKHDSSSSHHKSPNKEKSKKYHKKNSKSLEGSQKLYKEQLDDCASKKAKSKTSDEDIAKHSYTLKDKNGAEVSNKKSDYMPSDKTSERIPSSQDALTNKKIIDTKTSPSSISKSEDEKNERKSPSSSKDGSMNESLNKSNLYEKISSEHEDFKDKDKLGNEISNQTQNSTNETMKKSVALNAEAAAAAAADSNVQKSLKTINKNKQPNEDGRKLTPSSKEKQTNDSTKKSSSATKDKSATELYGKKSLSLFKEKFGVEGSKKLSSTAEEKPKKPYSCAKDASSEDLMKKTSPTSLESLSKFEKSLDATAKFNQLTEKSQYDRKKHRLKSKDIFSSSSQKSASKEHSFMKSNSFKGKRKHKESVDTSNTQSKPKSLENSDEKIKKYSPTKDENKAVRKETKEAKKQANKERNKQLREAFEIAIKEDTMPTVEAKLEEQPPNVPLQETLQTLTEQQPELNEIKLPPTPGESDVSIEENEKSSKPSSPSSPVEQPVQTAETNSIAVVEPDPLYDIEKFIEAGVNLLKRDYKLAEDEEEAKTKSVEDVQPKPAEKNDCTVVQCDKSNDPKVVITDITAADVNTPDSDAAVTNVLDFYETPVDTPASTPGSMTPSSSPTPTDTSVDTYYYSDGARRSHRLKKTSTPKALVGRGLVRDRDRERLAMRDDVEIKSYYSMEDHLMDLAEVEAKNAKFLKEMEERLSNFEVIKENEYHCERIVSREAKKMVCDCFLTAEEAERGELGCGEDCLNRLLMIECGVNCKVGDRCTNNRFQKYLCAPCRVFRTEKKGFGIMADVEIHPGEFIMEYVGEVLDSDEFEDRRVAYSKDKNRHYYFMALRSDAIIDATVKGNVSRFINHSCDPNAETQKWTVNGELRIGFFSRKNIMPGEEITFDYQYQRYGREAQRCYCESANCRGWIGEEPASDEEEQIDDEEDEDDDEDDDDEYEEDESDVVSMVKGLMSVEDGEDEDGKDETMSEETRRSIQDAAVKAQMRKNQKVEETVKDTAGLDGETDESKQKFMAYLSKISAKIELHKKNVREEKKRKRRRRKQAAIDRRPSTTAAGRFIEDPDLEDEIDFLSRCGLKNQSDTLRLSRLMVRAKLIPTRLNLLSILRAGELPCRRLFLDYHGLHLLHGWINEDGRTDMTIRMALLETLESLPIPNKTILTESKVYQAIGDWCNNDAAHPSKAEGGDLSSPPSDDSSKESGGTATTEEKQITANVDTETSSSINRESPKSDLEKLASKLLKSWDSLPEIFRIPKRERIEQMKEHEREADRQYAATVEAHSEEDEKKEISTDRYQRDRFQRRFNRPNSSKSINASSLNRRSDVLSPEDTKHLSKEQRRELFAAKVARDEAEKRQAERRREFETKCQFFGLDPNLTRPEDIPFCVSDDGKWYNQQRQIINVPPAFARVPPPTKRMSTNPADYFLPAAATNLPKEWAFAINEQGKIYYYHLKHRIPQWEPPTIEQINNTKWSDGESESEEDENGMDREELSEERIKEIEAIETQEDLTAYLKKIIQEQRQARYKRLVDQRSISPRKEEDRIYNQIEMRKYKENKEKIKKRKEEIRRRRNEAIKNSMLNMCTLGSLEENPVSSTDNTTKTQTESSDLPDDALPIQDYLLSSDEDNEDIDEMKAECNNSPLLDKIVQGDKIVDELDALTTKRPLKRPLPPHREINYDMSGPSGQNSNEASSHYASSMEKMEYKKRRQEKKEKSKRIKDISDSKYRRLKEKFRCEIAGIIVHHLKPYRKDSCIFGRIRSNEDFNHLAKKLTHFVMIKELKYCEALGQTLVVTESVKNKSREFIRKYMAKYENGYVKPDNDPEFKDIPYKL